MSPTKCANVSNRTNTSFRPPSTYCHICCVFRNFAKLVFNLSSPLKNCSGLLISIQDRSHSIFHQFHADFSIRKLSFQHLSLQNTLCSISIYGRQTYSKLAMGNHFLTTQVEQILMVVFPFAMYVLIMHESSPTYAPCSGQQDKYLGPKLCYAAEATATNRYSGRHFQNLFFADLTIQPCIRQPTVFEVHIRSQILPSHFITWDVCNNLLLTLEHFSARGARISENVPISKLQPRHFNSSPL